MQVTLSGTMLGCRYAVECMLRNGGGSIINTSTMLSLAVGNALPAYSTAKAGINVLTQWVAARYGKHGIRCNAVAPSGILTPLIERHMPIRCARRSVVTVLGYACGDRRHHYVSRQRSIAVSHGQVLRADGGTTITVPMYAASRALFDEP